MASGKHSKPDTWFLFSHVNVNKIQLQMFKWHKIVKCIVIYMGNAKYCDDMGTSTPLDSFAQSSNVYHIFFKHVHIYLYS